MTQLTLSLACAPYDRVQPLFDGRVKIAGCVVNGHPMPADEAFSRAYTTQDFDITELSASSHLLTSARGDSPYVGIPAFVSRSFRHSSFYIRTDRGVAGRQTLKRSASAFRNISRRRLYGRVDSSPTNMACRQAR